jgi:hypothetical protein
MFVIALQQHMPLNPALWLRLLPLVYQTLADPKK